MGASSTINSRAAAINNGAAGMNNGVAAINNGAAAINYGAGPREQLGFGTQYCVHSTIKVHMLYFMYALSEVMSNFVHIRVRISQLMLTCSISCTH